MQDPQHQIAAMTARLLAAKDAKESQAVAEELQRLIRDHISALRRGTEELRKSTADETRLRQTNKPGNRSSETD